MIEIKNLRNEKPENEWDVKVDRTSILGNPFYMKDESQRDAVCDKYEEYFYKKLDKDNNFKQEVDWIYRLLHKYHKLNLFCWCAPKRCHLKVCIAGSRSFTDYDLLVKKCNEILQNENLDTLEFVCGLAEGADKLGERYAKERGCAIKYFPAHWDDLTTEPVVIRTNKYGKKYNAAAGHNRNNEMRDYIKDDGILIVY